MPAGRPCFSTERADPSAWATTTRFLEAEPTLVWLHLPPDELVRRLTRRAEARDENKIRDPRIVLVRSRIRCHSGHGAHDRVSFYP